MQETQLTPSEIASMSEVMAVYMGADMPSYIKNSNGKIVQCILVYKGQRVRFIWIGNECSMYNEYSNGFEFHTSWDWLHEVWEKVREEETLFNDKNIWYLFGEHKSNVVQFMEENNILEAFKSLFDCITFINQLKEQENGNKEI